MKYQYWLSSLEMAAKEKIRLLEIFGTEEELYKVPKEEWEKVNFISDKAKESLRKEEEGKVWKDFEEEQKILEQQHIQRICYNHPEYPEKLREIYDPPYCLYIKGKLPAKNQKMIAVVGARCCSPYGQAVAKELGRRMARVGIPVVSGLAMGIDAAAHIGVMEGNGIPFGVLGCGIDVCYPPSNRKLYQQVEGCGGIITEYGPGVSPNRYTFPQRNRIISGLADIVVVVEGKKRSGSLITADYALDQGKVVYAVPGRIDDNLSYGTNWLISQGASPLFSLDEFVKELGFLEKDKRGHKKLMEFSLEKKERLLYSVLDFTPQSPDVLMDKTGLNFTEVTTGLFHLREIGAVEEVYKNYFVKSDL